MNLRPRPSSTALRLTLETLEDRSVPATLTVTNLNDAGAGSLRAEVAAAAAGDTIQFQAGLTGTLALTSGEIAISQSLTVQGPGAALVTIDAGANSRIFNVTGTLATQVAISGLTLTNGTATGSDGGAVLDNGAALTLSQVTLSASKTVLGRNGGGVAVDSGSLQLQQSQLVNDTGAGFGGGLYGAANAQVNVVDTLFRNDNAGFGGGILAFGNLTLTGSTVMANTASNVGGGIYVLGNVNLLSNDTITGNSAVSAAGGVENQGINTTVANSTIDGNHATGVDSVGGGLDNGFRTLNLDSTILAGNTAATGADINGSVNSDGHNLVLSTAGSSGLTASDVTGVDPMLGALTDNGGPTPTQLLLTGSPAIGKGSNPLTLNTDQRGFNRTGSAGLDIGAVAFNSTPPTATLGSAPNVDQNSNPNTYTFTVAYSDSQAIVGSSLASGNLIVAGPNGFAAYAILVSVDQPGNGASRTATYSIAAPGGSFTSASNGTYYIYAQPNQVMDVQGNYVAPGALGTFQVNILAPQPQPSPSPAPKPATIDDFVRALYRDVLHREADVTGLNGYTDLLNHGKSREWVARDIWESPEHRSLASFNPSDGNHRNEVDAFYAAYLHRTADDSGRTGYVNLLDGGYSYENTAVSILGSDEYFRLHGGVY